MTTHMDRRFAQLDRTARPTGSGLTRERLKALVPSAFAETAAPTTSQKHYRYMPTYKVIDALIDSGFLPVRAGEARTRIAGNEPFVRHSIVFRQPDSPLVRGELFPELALFNSHNGTSAFQLYFGIWRTLCGNGMIAVDAELANIRVPHSGPREIVDAVIDASTAVVHFAPRVMERIDRWREVRWSEPTRIEYAKQALRLRWPDEENPAPIRAADILQPQRRADYGDDAWRTFNVAQEAIIKGGQRYWRNGERRRTRAVASINTDLQLNKGLWTLTDRFARGEYVKAEDIIEGELA